VEAGEGEGAVVKAVLAAGATEAEDSVELPQAGVAGALEMGN